MLAVRFGVSQYTERHPVQYSISAIILVLTDKRQTSGLKEIQGSVYNKQIWILDHPSARTGERQSKLKQRASVG